ncbi:MAG: DUF2849 domain-containing protein [Beijerinckiaceae bacterium]|nr:DUF2849 domain-containing protein [Beijerinckiaceae bacterium]
MSYAISANRLTDGVVIFLSASSWAEDLASAERFADQAAAEAALEQRAKADAARNLLVDPTVFELRESGGRIEAAHIREAIRAKGPSVRPDLGKQAG